MIDSELRQLFQRYKEGSATQDEIKLLMEMLRDPEMEGPVKELLQKEIAVLDGHTMSRDDYDISDQRAEEMISRILISHTETPVVDISKSSSNIKKIWKYAAAAVVILIAGFLIFNKKDETKQLVNKQIENEILPGQDGAILTLADGRTIVLDNARDGKITDVVVKDGNKIYYENNNTGKVEYNTMTTPKGRQFSLVLPDGTQVWLNAASSITYPTAFVGNERNVSITGEAYFEVSHDAAKPFHVNVNGMDIKVLGTHFNVNSYRDEESVNTTLLQGSIKISVEGESQLLKKGHQAQVWDNNHIKLVTDADLIGVMAWKNGYFHFNGMGIEGVMRQLERWYDINVKYEGKIPNRLFAGQMDRNSTLSEVLRILQESNVHFKQEGRNIIVTP